MRHSLSLFSLFSFVETSEMCQKNLPFDLANKWTLV